MIQVYHVQDQAPEHLTRDVTWIRAASDLTAVKALWVAGYYTQVAHVATHSLDHAYGVTQNGVHTDSWCLNPVEDVTPLVAGHVTSKGIMGVRSTNVGDILVTESGEPWVVASVGFLKLEPQE
jgi:hypothetical protein